MARWSKLQRQLYQIVDERIRLQLHCAVYRMDSQRGSTGLPRYWITLGDEIIWDYPRRFVGVLPRLRGWYPYNTDISEISTLIRAYLDTPVASLLSSRFPEDRWGLVNILRASDRRIGSRQWPALKRKIKSRAALKVLQARMALAGRS